MKSPKSDEPPGPPCNHSNNGALVLLLYESVIRERKGCEKSEGGKVRGREGKGEGRGEGRGREGGRVGGREGGGGGRGGALAVDKGEE